MIAVDINVLFRYLLNGGQVQAEKSQKLINGSQKVLLTDVVLTETMWVLTGKRYEFLGRKRPSLRDTDK
jgi:predicted nucleic-acid-binding protein